MTFQDEALDRECGVNRGSRAGGFISLLSRCFTALWWPVPAGRGEGSASHSKYNERLWAVLDRPGKEKQKASCNQSGFPGVNRVSVTLKNSFPVAEPCGQGRVAVSTGLAYAESGTAGGTAADVEVCGLWHVSYPVPKLGWTKTEASTGCLALCGEQPPAQSLQGLCERGHGLVPPGWARGRSLLCKWGPRAGYVSQVDKSIK